MSDSGKQGMSDLEMTKLCAEAMGLSALPEYELRGGDWYNRATRTIFYPLHDDAQAMALVKRFGLFLGRFSEGYWCVDSPKQQEQTCSFRDSDLNRAVVECVAKMQATALSTGRAPTTATTK